MTRPFELNFNELQARLDEMVKVTFGDLQSQFLTLPRGTGFIDYADFQAAYEVLKRHTQAFSVFTEDTVWKALREDGMTLVVLRTILGFSPPEWADLARSERECDVPQNAARTLDTKVRKNRKLFAREGDNGGVTTARTRALVSVAVEYITRGAPPAAQDTVHRLAKVDTASGILSIQHAANFHVPYAVLLYERYLGRPFASHRDSVSELVGDVMESAIEEQLLRRRITFRKTGRAERIDGFDQAPDFFVPTELSPTVIIEAKITGDDGTARDKVARILRLASMRDERERGRQPSFELVACIDGRGFGVRRQDMRDMLLATRGKVFTLAALNQLVENTRLKEFLPAEARVAFRRAAAPRDAEKYRTCVPLLTLKAAAGAFGDVQAVEPEGWVEPNTQRRLCPGMFVAQIAGHSMEPRIPDAAWCLFRSPVTGSRQGRVVLVQHRSIEDPETHGSYTVKRYESDKELTDAGDWRHRSIRLVPENPEFEPIVLRGVGEEEVSVIAELVEVLG